MNFTTGRTYRFVALNCKGKANQRMNSFKRVYLRHVGKVDLFRHPTAGWLEGFTLQQFEDYEITEVRA